ncbi:MAG: hypothetical protein R3E76_13570 [Planctomycetota bacterium]
MKTSVKSLLLLTVLAAGLAACESLPRGPDREAEPVEYGRWMYERKCQQCHDLYDPREFTQRSLVRALKRYAPRAGLQREDRPYVEQYLVEDAKDAP